MGGVVGGMEVVGELGRNGGCSGGGEEWRL